MSGAGKISVENLVLNSNVLKMIEDEGLSDNLIDLISTQGTHTSIMDSVMQTYLSDALQSGDFKIQLTQAELQDILSEAGLSVDDPVVREIQDELGSRLGYVRQGSFSAFEQIMRRKASSSSAIVLTTNVRDLSMMSDEMFQFLSGTKTGQSLVSLSIDAQILQERLGVDEAQVKALGENFEASLQYFEGQGSQPGRFGIANYKNIEINQEAARALIQTTLEEARQGAAAAQVISLESGKNITLNVSQDRINNVQINNLQMSQAEEINRQRASRIAVGRVEDMTPEQLAVRRNTTAEVFGTEIGKTGQIIYGTGQVERYQELLLERGLPFAHLEVRSRVYGTEMSRATEKVGVTVLREMAAQSADSVRKKSLDTAARQLDAGAGRFSEYGLVYAMGQGQELSTAWDTSVRPMGTASKMPEKYARLVIDEADQINSRMILPFEIFKDLEIDQETDTGVRRIKLGNEQYLSKGDYRLHMSIPQTSNDDGIVNFVFHHNFKNRNEAEDLVRQINRSVLNLKVDYEGYIGVTEPVAQLQQAFEAKGVALTRDQVANFVIGEEATIASMRKTMEPEQFGKLERAYQEIVEQQAEKLMDTTRGGFIAMTLRGEAALQVEQATEAFLEESAQYGDTKLQRLVYRILGVGKSGAVLTPAMDIEANTLADQVASIRTAEMDAMTARISELEGVVAEAETAGMRTVSGKDLLNMATSESAADQEMYGIIDAGRSAETELADLRAQMRTATEGLTESQAQRQVVQRHGDEGARAFDEFVSLASNISKEEKLADNLLNATSAEQAMIKGRQFFSKNKGMILAGLATIGVGAYATRRQANKAETDLYDETFRMGGPQKEQRRFGAQDALLNARKYKTTADPLATAGVVGNLDRNKIGHHNMSPRKNDHLFKG